MALEVGAAAPDFAVDLNDQAGANAWPIVSATFVLLPEDAKDPAQSAAVVVRPSVLEPALPRALAPPLLRAVRAPGFPLKPSSPSTSTRPSPSTPSMRRRQPGLPRVFTPADLPSIAVALTTVSLTWPATTPTAIRRSTTGRITWSAASTTGAES